MGVAERDLRDRAVDSLAEIERLDVRPMFGGFGFYIEGILTAAAWDGAFRLRYRRAGRWVYEPVPDGLVDDPDLLVALARRRAAALARLPEATRQHRPGVGS